MDFEDDAKLDTSQVRDLRGRRGRGGGFPSGGRSGGGFPFPSGGGSRGAKVGGGVGGLGLIGVVLVFALQMCGGGGGLGGGLSNLNQVEVADGEVQGGSDASADINECQTGADADNRQDCRLLAVINSVQKYWDAEFTASKLEYEPSVTTFFEGQVDTGCGQASAAVGPFYCPADKGVYLDLAFFDEFRSKFGATGGPFAESYVIAHEYGHHIQNLLGTSAQVQQSGDNTGPESAAVRLELQADCLAGVWANHAQNDGIIAEISEENIRDGLDAAAKVGDDYIQKEFQGRVNKEAWTHGSSAQRQKWFTTGLRAGNYDACDTFSGAI